MSKSIRKHKPIIGILVAAFITTGVIFLLFGADSKINRANIACISAYGWEVEEEPAEISRLAVPEEFNFVYETYNRIAMEAGFDLTPYRGKTLTRYSYLVTNHKDSETGLIRANVLVFRNQIVAADLSSMETGGFTKSIHDTTDMVE